MGCFSIQRNRKIHVIETGEVSMAASDQLTTRLAEGKIWKKVQRFFRRLGNYFIGKTGSTRAENDMSGIQSCSASIWSLESCYMDKNYSTEVTDIENHYYKETLEEPDDELTRMFEISEEVNNEINTYVTDFFTMSLGTQEDFEDDSKETEYTCSATKVDNLITDYVTDFFNHSLEN